MVDCPSTESDDTGGPASPFAAGMVVGAIAGFVLEFSVASGGIIRIGADCLVCRQHLGIDRIIHRLGREAAVIIARLEGNSAAESQRPCFGAGTDGNGNARDCFSLINTQLAQKWKCFLGWGWIDDRAENRLIVFIRGHFEFHRIFIERSVRLGMKSIVYHDDNRQRGCIAGMDRSGAEHRGNIS